MLFGCNIFPSLDLFLVIQDLKYLDPEILNFYYFLLKNIKKFI